MSGFQWALIGFIVGFMIGFAVKRWLAHRKDYVGTILISHKDQKLVYSLVLDDYPETIQFKKEVVFKVDTTPDTLDRD